MEIIEESKNRSQSDCETFSKCGGCSLRHIKYEYTLELKKASVENTLKKALGREIKISEVLKMDKPYNYRNKFQIILVDRFNDIEPLTTKFWRFLERKVIKRNN